MTVNPRSEASSSANSDTVLPASMNTAWPGSSSLAASRAMARFSSLCILARSFKGASGSGAARLTPP
ncbi:hypothetical protein D3C71_1699090 [compost metagenome]